MADRKKITAIKGRKIEAVFSTGSLIIIRLERGMEVQAFADAVFDKTGVRFENDAPDLPRR